MTAYVGLRPVEVDAGGLTLVPWRDGDGNEVRDAFNEPHIARWGMRRTPFDDVAARDYLARRRTGWESGEMTSWGVRDPVSGELLGSVTLRDIGRWEGSAEASYWVLAAHRGRGVAPAALLAATRFGFDRLGLHRIALRHAVPNTASCRVAQKAAYLLEGTMRSSTRLGDEWVDDHLHARLEQDEP